MAVLQEKKYFVAGTDQLAHQGSLISAHVIDPLESIIAKFATFKILIF